MRTMEWLPDSGILRMIDQRKLPAALEYYDCRDAESVVVAIREMVVRGAPAIGAAAAFGLALTAQHSAAKDAAGLRLELQQAAKLLLASRPTAINLKWALTRILNVVNAPAASKAALQEDVVNEAIAIAEEDVLTNRQMAINGAALIEDGDTIIHHCNTGSLATVDWGTALGAIHMAHEQGKHVQVLVDETRPRLQGARLTAWELTQYGIPYEIISDGAAGYFLHKGLAQKVMFGADRVAANGDVANKIGSYMLALAAHANDVPVYSVFPTTTVDLTLPNGDLIPIEERDQDEVLNIQVNGENVAPAGAKARNPAFDITPHTLLTALVTEKGLVYPPFRIHLSRLMGK